jgi:hypothetical protein
MKKIKKLLILAVIALFSTPSFATVDCVLENGDKLKSTHWSVAINGERTARSKFSYQTKSADWEVYFGYRLNREYRVYKQFDGREGVKGVIVLNHDDGTEETLPCR